MPDGLVGFLLGFSAGIITLAAAAVLRAAAKFRRQAREWEAWRRHVRQLARVERRHDDE